VKRVAALLAPAAALLLAACAGAPPATEPGGPGAVAPPAVGDEALPPPGAAPFATLATRFTARAVKQEAAGDLRRALDSWKVVAALRSEAVEPRRRVVELSARLQAAADQHFRDGNARLQEGNIDAARREFLLSLASDPDHARSLDALKNRLEPDATPYTVAAGDTFESIAKKQYGDPAKSAIVARVNNLDPAGKPVPGTVLTLPNLSLPAAKPPVIRAPEAAPGAPEAPDSGYDTEPADLGGEAPAPAPVPAAPTAPVLPTAPAAPATRVEPPKAPEPARKDIPAAQDAVEARKREKAEELYNAGVRFFINQKLDEAILSWEKTLELYPEHPKAAKDIVKARGLQQRLKELR
jgi:LysM repeat protein